MKRFGLWMLVMGSVLLYGCAGMTERPPEEVPVEERGPSAEEQAAMAAEEEAAEGAEAGAAEMGGEFAGSPLEDPDSELSERVVYFAFDSADIRSEGKELLAAHAEFLANNPDVSVVLEGHTDERGSREYNLALGERRAKSVQKYLVLQGAGRDQLEVVSFGEERPVATEHNESAWALNRRVELVYSGY